MGLSIETEVCTTFAYSWFYTNLGVQIVLAFLLKNILNSSNMCFIKFQEALQDIFILAIWH